MKHLSFQYHLSLTMDQPIQKHFFTLHCIPASNATQTIYDLKHSVTPVKYIRQNIDQWGNHYLFGSCPEPHQCFEIDLNGHAEVGISDGIPNERFGMEAVFALPTPLTAVDSALEEFALTCCPANSKVYEQAYAVSEAVHNALTYAPGVTQTSTSAADSFAIRSGVCQDYSQIMLAVLRKRGIPARYVAGMLVGEGKSHAWVEVLCNGKWVAFDPTNNQPVVDQHIKFSHGRDFTDCQINRGIFRGTANQQTDISVIVTEI